MLLFVTCLEPLFRHISLSNKYTGYRYPNNTNYEIKYLSYADDISLILFSSDSINNITALFEDFEKLAGVPINRDKYKGLWIGEWADRQLNYAGFKWTNNIYQNQSPISKC